MKNDIGILFFILSMGFLFTTESCRKEDPLIVSYAEYNVNENINVQSMTMVDAMTGFACGGTKGGSGSIYKTVDGGQSWQSIFQVPNCCLYDIAFVNDTLGFACGENLLLLKTTDGGLNWIDQHSVQGQPPINYSGTLRKIFCVDSKTIYVAGGKDYQVGITYKTFDGGGFWIYNTFDNELRGIYFKDKYNGYFAGYGTILTTSDSANSFNRLNVNDDFFTSLAFTNTSIGYASGYNGGIYKTENNGSSWKEELKKNNDVNHTRHFNQLKFLDDNIGYAVGNNGLIMFTEDEGWHWRIIKKTTSDNLFSICILNKQSIFITGTEGRIFRLNR